MTLTLSTTALLEKATAKYEMSLDRAALYLKTRGFTHEAAVAARLGVVVDPEPGHEHNTGRLSIPYVTPAGVVNLKFRCMGAHDCKSEGHQKYMGLHGSAGKPRLYNVNAFFARSPFIAITEGELDALVLSHYAGIPAVGCPGVSTWQPHFPRCFTGYDVVFMFADGDQAGRDMARKIGKELVQARPVFLPDDMDVNSVYLLEGADGLRQRAGL